MSAMMMLCYDGDAVIAVVVRWCGVKSVFGVERYFTLHKPLFGEFYLIIEIYPHPPSRDVFLQEDCIVVNFSVHYHTFEGFTHNLLDCFLSREDPGMLLIVLEPHKKPDAICIWYK